MNFSTIILLYALIAEPAALVNGQDKRFLTSMSVPTYVANKRAKATSTFALVYYGIFLIYARIA